MSIFVSHFPSSHIENHRQRSNVCKFSLMILKCGNDIHCLKISDEFDYGGSASLNIGIMDRFTSRLVFSIPGLISRVKAITFDTNVGLKMLLNINKFWVYHRRSKTNSSKIKKKSFFLENPWNSFSLQKAFFQDIWHKIFDINSSVSQTTV